MPPLFWYILVGNYTGIPNIQKYMECVGYMWRNPVYQTFQTHKLALKNFDKSLTDTLEKEGKLQKRSREGGKTLVKSGAGIANLVGIV
jgi:hypothetical protein